MTTSQRNLHLFFEDLSTPTLALTEFSHPLLAAPLRTVRGKTSGPFTGHGSFQWSSAVVALSVFFVEVEYQRALGAVGAPVLTGGRASLAASLDYAITKQPVWLTQMFGVDSQGDTILRRIITRHNSEMKLPGPVTLGFNANHFGEAEIKVYCGNVSIREARKLGELRDQIIYCYQERRPKVTSLSAHQPSHSERLNATKVYGSRAEYNETPSGKIVA